MEYNREWSEVYDSDKMQQVYGNIMTIIDGDMVLNSAQPLNHIAKLQNDIEVYRKNLLRSRRAKYKVKLERADLAEDRLYKIMNDLIDGGARLL